MLSTSPIMGFVATERPVAAKNFYESTLRLPLIEDTPFAIVFDAHGTLLRVTKVQTVTVPPYTVLGWKVEDIEAEMRDLISRGVVFERYPGLTQNAAGVWTSPDGARIAWFKDPDGNTLSLAQLPEH